MSAVEYYVGDYLEHYSSPYYDPVKAREYYLRTRELKDKKPALETDTQREGWSYASNQISEKQKAEKESTAKAHNDKLDALRTNAEAATKAMREKLTARLAEINKETPIPSNASPKLRAFLEKQNASRRARASRETRKEMARISKEVGLAIARARAAYSGVQRGIDEKYKAERESEYENIRTKVE